MKKWMRRLGIAAAGVAGIVVLFGAVVYAVSELRMRRVYEVAATPVTVHSSNALAARGKHVATAIGKCVDCHGTDLGGKVFIDEPAIGRFVASNLTRGKGGVQQRYSDRLLARAIRHGIDEAGKPLLFMPSQEFHNFSDADLTALISYLRTLKPVDRELPGSTVGPVGRGLYLAGQLPLLPAEIIDHSRRPPAVRPAVSIQYGEYLATVGGCMGCHGPGLSGGRVPGTPPKYPAATNLTRAGIGTWTEADFFRALRTGMRPNGTVIHPFMPWVYAGQMSDDEIRAVWMYLRSVPPRPTGSR